MSVIPTLFRRKITGVMAIITTLAGLLLPIGLGKASVLGELGYWLLCLMVVIIKGLQIYFYNAQVIYETYFIKKSDQ